MQDTKPWVIFASGWHISDGETTALPREVGAVSFLTSVQVGAILALQAKKCLAAVAEL